LIEFLSRKFDLFLTCEMFVLTSRQDVKPEMKQEPIESPPEPPNKKHKWSFQSSKHSG